MAAPPATKPLTEGQLAFLEWLTDPERAGSQNGFAANLGVDSGTLSKWKKDPWFRDAWNQRLAELNVSPERTQNVVDAAYKLAIRGDVQAMKLYLQLIERISPDNTVVIKDRRAAELSDADLAVAAREHLRVIEGGQA